MGSMCDRCGVSGCLLNYRSKACAAARKRDCPYVVYTTADRIRDSIRDMTDEELAENLIPMLMEFAEDGIPTKETMLELLRSES